MAATKKSASQSSAVQKKSAQKAVVGKTTDKTRSTAKNASTAKKTTSSKGDGLATKAAQAKTSSAKKATTAAAKASTQPRKGRVTQKQLRALAILEELKRLYPEAPCSLDFDNPLQLMIATMLAAQCTDERVNKVTPALFDRYPDVEAFAGADLDELEQYVKSTGFYRNKAKNIRLNCQRLIEVYGGEVPNTMEDLISLAGVARKTANVVLAHGFGINGGVTVDTHVKRITNLLKLTKSDNPVQIERDLMKLLPQHDWENWSIRLVYHGRAVCVARRPDCDRCTLIEFCPSGPKLLAGKKP